MGNETSKKPGNGRRTNKAKGYKPTGRPGAGGITGTMQSPPDIPERNPLLWIKTMVPSGQGYMKAKWTRRASPKKSKPLDKSKKKGSPSSYENLKKSKPIGKGRKKGVG